MCPHVTAESPSAPCQIGSTHESLLAEASGDSKGPDGFDEKYGRETPQSEGEMSIRALRHSAIRWQTPRLPVERSLFRHTRACDGGFYGGM